QNEQDKQHVAQLQTLRQKRDQLYRRLVGDDEPNPDAQTAILALEKAITQQWHELLIRNTAYQRDADLWQIHPSSAPDIQAKLDDETALVEYFVVSDQIVVFVVTKTDVSLHYLPTTLKMVQKLHRSFRLKLQFVERSQPAKIEHLQQVACKQLQRFYDQLIAPIAELLTPYRRLTVVPHDILHYLPFHAFHDGQDYLLATYQINYLPNAGVLAYIGQKPTATRPLLALGYSAAGALPHTVSEVTAIAEIMEGTVYVEAEATLACLKTEASQYRALHLATHGDFRADNPLFSGLTFADGQLTTLDVFNLRLQASLVTLSACQTGRYVVGGGDELLGLSRAFLYAGTASLVLSLWQVNDAVT
ncbi:MAG: CHAT domain-containing protein, partial [Methylococcales bacterium]|nr:CHAT domain-containing protein [Methylococcales bacterium]